MKNIFLILFIFFSFNQLVFSQGNPVIIGDTLVNCTESPIVGNTYRKIKLQRAAPPHQYSLKLEKGSFTNGICQPDPGFPKEITKISYCGFTATDDEPSSRETIYCYQNPEFSNPEILVLKIYRKWKINRHPGRDCSRRGQLVPCPSTRSPYWQGEVEYLNPTANNGLESFSIDNKSCTWSFKI